MAIKAVKAVPYYVMKDYLKGNPVNSIKTLSQNYDRVWIVSVTNAPTCPVYAFHGRETEVPLPLVEDGDDRIALQFDDIEDKNDAYSGITLPRHPQFVYFDEAMAEKVVKFIRKAHETSSDSNDLLVVNCHMGVSRSGAISDFTRVVCGLDYDSWKRMNVGVNPNLLVRDLLHWAWKESQKTP